MEWLICGGPKKHIHDRTEVVDQFGYRRSLCGKWGFRVRARGDRARPECEPCVSKAVKRGWIKRRGGQGTGQGFRREEDLTDTRQSA